MKTAVIVGMARSGIASARLLYENGWRVIINDSKSSVTGLVEALEGVEYEDALGIDPVSLLEGADLMVLSPGVSMFQPFVEAARVRGVEVIGEIELGARYVKGDLLCITGTNGKTTCTALLGEICKASGRPTHVLGNIGTPLTQNATQTSPGDLVVVETAALQLEGNIHFHANAAAVTNITEDHQDRFLTMENYINAKCKIFENQTADDVAVLNYDDPVVRAMNTRTNARVVYFSRREELKEGLFVRDGDIVFNLDGKENVLMKVTEVRIPGTHNLENALLCAAMALSKGIEPQTVRKAIMEFPGVEHRIEFVCEKKGVRYYNDSKGTNPDSTMKAIAAMDRPSVLLLGGYDKHSTFGALFEAIKQSGQIREIVLLGETADKLLQYAKEAEYENIHLHRGAFSGAVELAKSLARPGENVLLSPACASWDMFESFEERGKVYKEIVRGFED